MLALSVFSAIVDAVGGSGAGAFAALDAPATPERILCAVEAVAAP
jgi:xanthine dehydrogenase large subunit